MKKLILITINLLVTGNVFCMEPAHPLHNIISPELQQIIIERPGENLNAIHKKFTDRMLQQMANPSQRGMAKLAKKYIELHEASANFWKTQLALKDERIAKILRSWKRLLIIQGMLGFGIIGCSIFTTLILYF